MRRIILFLCGALGTIALCNFFPNAATNPEAGVILGRLPSEIPGYWGQEREMSEEELYWLPEDTQAEKRQYYRDGLDERGGWLSSLTVNIILAGSDKRSLHKPEVCMKGQGWNILSRNVEPLKINGKDLEVMDLRLGRSVELSDGSKEQLIAHYIYWWVGKNESTPHSWQRITKSLINNLLYNVNDRWAYPSVMVYSLEKGSESEEEARQRALDFITNYVPLFQKKFGAE